MHRLYGCNVCGEGGEYETLTLDCPLFHRGRIVLDATETRLHSPDTVAPVGVLHPLAFHVEPKAPPVTPQAHPAGPPAGDAGPRYWAEAVGSGEGSGEGSEGPPHRPQTSGDDAPVSATHPAARASHLAPAGHDTIGQTPGSNGDIHPARVVDVPHDFRPTVDESGAEARAGTGGSGAPMVGVGQGAAGFQAWCAAGGHGATPAERVVTAVRSALSAVTEGVSTW